MTRTVLAIGTSDEQTYVYIGRELTRGICALDENEFIETEEIGLDDALNMIRDGRIVDSKTIIAIYAYWGKKCSQTSNHII